MDVADRLAGGVWGHLVGDAVGVPYEFMSPDAISTVEFRGHGSHNQPAGPNLEPSHIYHFKGRVARCSTFTGMGTDNKGNRIAFGSPTTDYGVMRGEYWAARSAQQGTLTHI